MSAIIRNRIKLIEFVFAETFRAKTGYTKTKSSDDENRESQEN
jgi:hypothetical protein